MRRSTASSEHFALALLACHLAVVAVFGRYYAKIEVPLGPVTLFPTELVIGACTVLGWSAIKRVPFDRMTKLVLAFDTLGVLWLLLAGTGDLHGAGVKAFSFWVYSLLYFITRGAAISDEQRWKLLRVFGIAAIAGALVGLWQMYSGVPLFGGTDGFASGFEETSTGSTRWVAGELALYGSFAALIAAVDTIVRRRFTSTHAVILVAAVVELVLAQHRTAFVALPLTLLATALFLVGSTRALKGLVKLVVIGALVAVVLVWVFGTTYLDETIDRIAHTSDLGDTNIDWRLLNWYEVFDGITQRPLGHGFAVWDFLFTADDPLNGSHNSFLDLAYRVGVPGLLLLLAIPVTLVRQTRARIARTDPSKHVLAITVCACMLAYLVFASFNVVLETPHLSVLFWVLVGIGTGTVVDGSASVEVHVRAADVPVAGVQRLVGEHAGSVDASSERLARPHAGGDG